MKTSDAFPSKYLKADELPEDVIATIEYVDLAELKAKDGSDETKPVVFFKELGKGLILNKTNWSRIVEQHGDESDNWGGSQVTLTVEDVDAFGETVEAIRVLKPRKRKTSPRPQGGARSAVNTSQDAPTVFWLYVNEHGLDGSALISAANGNFVDALDRATNEVQTRDQQNAEELPA